MSSQIRLAASVLGAILLIGLTALCGFGFLASYELGFPNVWHFIYGAAGLAAAMAATWLVFRACKRSTRGSSP
jgi:hypothetical protein